MRKIPIVITAYTGGQDSELKKKMVETLCKELSKLGMYVCLASHSSLPESTQQYCDGYIYDSDNDFHVNGVPEEDALRNHGIAEFKSVHNALNYLDKLGFTEFFKLTYDADPKIPYATIIERAQYIIDTHNKEFICSGWGDNRTLGALMYYSTFDFFRKITSIKDTDWLRSKSPCFEVTWFLNAERLGVLDKIFMCHIRLYDDFLGFPIRDYSHQGGTEIDPYPY